MNEVYDTFHFEHLNIFREIVWYNNSFFFFFWVCGMLFELGLFIF